MNVTRLREEKEPPVNQCNTLNAEVGNLKGDRTHCRQRAHMRSPHTCDPDPCRCGETHRVPTTLYLGSHIHTHQGDPTSQDPASKVTRSLSTGDPSYPDTCTWVTCPQSKGDLTSPDPAPGVTRPLIQDTMALQGAPLMWKQAGFLGRPGMGKCVRWVSSPHTCPREVLLFSLWFCVILNVFKDFMLELNTLPWFWQAQSFLVSLTC